MNKRIFVIFAVVAVALSSDALAQQNTEGDSNPPAIVIRMLQATTDGEGKSSATIHTTDGVFIWTPSIADELNLEPTQREEIQEFVRGLHAPSPDSKYMDMNLSDRFVTVREEVNQSMQPEQQTRYGEVTFQLSGGLDSPFLNDRTLEFLELTPAQKEQIRAAVVIRDEESAPARQRFDIHNAPPAEREAFMKALAAADAARKKFADRVKTILTPAQRGRMEKLTAEIPALREKLGMKQEKPVPQQQGQVPQEENHPQTPAFAPGSGSWQPGDPVPHTPAPSEGRRRFPRSESE